MKSLLVIGCLLLAADVIRAEEDMFEAVREEINACAAEQDISPEELVKLNDQELQGDDKKKFGCLKLCLMKKTEIYDGENMNAEKFEQLAQKMFKGDADQVAKVMQNMVPCTEEAKAISDECEAAFEFSHCLMRKAQS